MFHIQGKEKRLRKHEVACELAPDRLTESVELFRT